MMKTSDLPPWTVIARVIVRIKEDSSRSVHCSLTSISRIQRSILSCWRQPAVHGLESLWRSGTHPGNRREGVAPSVTGTYSLSAIKAGVQSSEVE